MLGYTDWKQTLESFDADGYFHTGDLGHRVNGDFITVSGRKKDLIIRGGENISPKEIEDVLHRHPGDQGGRDRRHAARAPGRDGVRLT